MSATLRHLIEYSSVERFSGSGGALSTNKFTTITFPISTLLGQIKTGQIALPELQRPFVWERSQVRDLLDSLYRGYPAGYFLLWQANPDVKSVQIGVDGKQAEPSLLVVDGQQRLTSLYAVFHGVPVYDDKFQATTIRIAFNPISERFEVSNTLIERDPEWVADVSAVLSGKQGGYAFISTFLGRLKAGREVDDDLVTRVAANLSRLESLTSYTFNAIQLSYDLPIEEVSEIFVRVNSKGTKLDQSDFILTLMSVHWDKGRKELEEFCRAAQEPTTTGSSPFNWFIQPSPDQLLRVVIGLGQRRARLKSAYEILRGKDLESHQVSAENRALGFEKLQSAQAEVLDLTNWLEYMKAIQAAGFRSGRMITSKNTIVYSYLIYLIGRRDYGLDHGSLRKALSRSFMMCVLTSRYTGSAETQVEKDIRRLGEATNGKEFLGIIGAIVDAQLTGDFWEVALPDQLRWSGGFVPSMFAYYAALNLLGAKVLFSSLPVHDLLDPTHQPKKAALDRHHLFPKAYLKSINITGPSRLNQVANYALLEWPDNIKISDQAPADYFPTLFAERVPAADQDEARFLHALPFGWEDLPYDEFLKRRQVAIAKVIKKGFERLGHSGGVLVAPAAPRSVRELVLEDESMGLEFKSSLFYSYKPEVPEKVITGAVVKTIAGFLNTEGGTLLIGVADKKDIVGLGNDYAAKRLDRDGFENVLSTTIMNWIDPVAVHRCRLRFEEVDGTDVCIVDVEPSPRPVYATVERNKVFYVRVGNSTRQYDTQETVAYIAERWGVS